MLKLEENWKEYLKKRGNYICDTCFSDYGKTYYQKDSVSNSNKQLARSRVKKSAVIFAYGDKCAICQEDDYDKLTIVNLNGPKHKHGNIYDWLYDHVTKKDNYQVLCYNCEKSKISYKDKYALENKKIVMEKFGGCCIECQEDKIEKLILQKTIGGEDHRQLHSGSNLYRWLIKNHYPIELQVVCFNCYFSKLNRKVLDLDRI
jgi:hypothetical protein